MSACSSGTRVPMTFGASPNATGEKEREKEGETANRGVVAVDFGEERRKGWRVGNSKRDETT